LADAERRSQEFLIRYHSNEPDILGLLTLLNWNETGIEEGNLYLHRVPNPEECKEPCPSDVEFYLDELGELQAYLPLPREKSKTLRIRRSQNP
jgi:hypothetical protein